MVLSGGAGRVTRPSAEARTQLLISLREARLVVQRILLVAGLPGGLTADVGDAIVYAQAMGLDPFDRLFSIHAELWKRRAPIAVSRDAQGATRLDCHGRHAWLVAPSLLDLLAECHAEGRVAVLVASKVADIEQLALLTAFAQRTGQRVRVELGDAARITALSPPTHVPGGIDPFLHEVLKDGLDVDAALWWQLYHLSNTSLSPDSVQSRRHAGPIIVEADGGVIGRLDSDDDTDVALLLQGPPLDEAALQPVSKED
jgi:hypothetical protein